MCDSKKEGLQFFESWALIKKLGSGGFGEVFVWKNHETDQIVATKCLKRDDYLMADQISKLKERWKKEYDWTKNLMSEYIVHEVKLDDAAFLNYLTKNQGWPEMPVIVMEYCDGGDLRSLLQKPQNLNGLCEFDVRKILQSLRHAIQYLHEECNIEHRDLKPDNIVIVGNGPNRMFKLIDFGFARQVMTDATIRQSHVGTNHYFAPEIIDGKYKKSVDYWSFGVMAVEIMCGILPFIPHQSMKMIYEVIKEKKRSCIAITENPFKSESLQHHTKLPSQNHLSRIFAERIEKWLMLALDTDYKRRGYHSIPCSSDANRPTIFSELDAILSQNILTVFCVCTLEFYAYEITPTLSMDELHQKFQNNASKKVRIILPIGHPCKQITKETQPIDLYVENWLDTNDENNPPAMLYLVNQCDYNEFSSPNIQIMSTVIKQCMKLSNDEYKTLPPWYVKQFALDTHFILSFEQKRFKATVLGLQALALELQESILYFDIRTLHTKSCILNGLIEQYNTMINTAERVNGSKLKLFPAFIQMYKEFLNEIIEEYSYISHNCNQLFQQRESVLYKVTVESKNKEFEDLVSRDVFQLKQFIRSYNQGNQLFIETEKSLKHCLKQRDELFKKGSLIHKMAMRIIDLDKEFSQIQDAFFKINSLLLDKQKQIIAKTEDFFRKLQLLYKNNYSETKDKYSTNNYVDNDSVQVKANNSICGSSASMINIIDVGTNDLINDVNSAMALLSSLHPDDTSIPNFQ